METIQLVHTIKENIGHAIVGNDRAIDLLLIALLCEGHVLIEDVPGVGKTSLAQALADSVGCAFRRIQFTPDVLPSDIVGFNMPDMRTGEFAFRPGMIMSQIILADEINRTSPKTQSSLLEVMEERQVTVDGVTYKLPRPFLVLATQNPVEYIGTYPLPEAQMDRFLLRISLGYPTMGQEIQIMEKYANADPRREINAVVSDVQVIEIQEQVKSVYCSKAIMNYVASIIQRTRNHEHLSLGVSPRGTLSLLRAAQGSAYLYGRDYVTPDDVQGVCESVLCHRMVVKPESKMKDMTSQRVIASILNAVKVPVNLHD